MCKTVQISFLFFLFLFFKFIYFKAFIENQYSISVLSNEVAQIICQASISLIM